MERLTCFKAYDVRGQLGNELNIDIAYRIGRAYCEYFSPKSIVVGADVRLTSEELKSALTNGLLDSGCDVIDLGITGTEEVYFATQYLDVDGGIEVTASHNPINYNGMKLVRQNAKPISGDTGLREIQKIAESNSFSPISNRGSYKKLSTLNAYIDHLMSYITLRNIKPMRLVVNSGNGAAGHVIDEIEKRFREFSIPVEFIKIQHIPDGNFPNGIPNPLLVENRKVTSDAVLKYNADIGIAWDGDFDRCFLFDEQGQFIEGYYIVGMLAEAFLQKEQGAKIIHDPRLFWNTIDIVTQASGIPVMSKTGHAFIKERMREENAIYGGEMSAHHYFRDFAYCDSGMIPWLLIIELLSTKNIKLFEAVKKNIYAYPSSGEINLTLDDPQKFIQHIYEYFKNKALCINYIDGISMEFEFWRFNLRSSNTESVVRLNVESKNNTKLMEEKTTEILNLIHIFHN
ncbi:phosphomannomutase/phosphoglucomutase [Photorhabdus temperata]|uniref:Phosphomannomutase n=1 Tax=Photorhabdus temperata subsp. temperata Meg1 TaxID=1393735 RepID=A0A081RV29_PHOTE|nr:phosphomannomutase/phosphoglucomutase [Photorhabdus temperata]KER02532.1 phosphomannomutase [Photorhabdus temperata subsp. temperata Meg1]